MAIRETAWSDVPREELDAWADNFECARPHGGESIAELRTRVMSLLTDLADTRGPAGTPLLVTHAGIIRAALTVTQHSTKTDERDHQIDYGQWRHVDLGAMTQRE